MLKDDELKIKAFEILRRELGDVETEKFISLLIKNPFDYTEWRKELFADKSIKDVSNEAMMLRDKK